MTTLEWAALAYVATCGRRGMVDVDPERNHWSRPWLPDAFGGDAAVAILIAESLRLLGLVEIDHAMDLARLTDKGWAAVGSLICEG